MKHVGMSDIGIAVEIPAPFAPLKMTRTEKLMHWAGLVRACGYHLRLFHNLEYMSTGDRMRLRVYGSGSAFELAIRDPKFQAEGLSEDTSIQGVMDYFELSIHDAHEFSCDCGGAIRNDDQANRIERLAR